MSRTTNDLKILPLIHQIKSDHPFWGYRRIWAYLKYRLDISVNKKRVYRIMKEHNLLVQPNARLKAIRSNQAYKNKPKATRPNQYWGIDMTKVMISEYGWRYLTIIKDWYSKKLIGYSLSEHSRTNDWLNALNRACNNQFPQGILSKEHELHLVSDNGSQPTSGKFMQACSVMELKQIFTSYNNPKGNAETERLIRTIKEDLIWVREFSSPNELEEALRQWIQDYNTDYPHSSLNYMTPEQFEKEQLLVTKI
ncbi:MAG: IS3 family transposase [Candidatus Omnitrophica bacterium]|nr:IS3 family transposase [Candidatus Omnitrophota bacterium]